MDRREGMNGGVVIREATHSDIADITRLCGQLGYDVLEVDVTERFNKLISDDDHAVFVAGINAQKIAGWVHVHGRHLLEAKPYAEIGGLIVDVHHRRLGIGEKLMRKCEEWARQKGYDEILLRSRGHRKDAHEFYKRIGYKNIKWQEVFNLEL